MAARYPTAAIDADESAPAMLPATSPSVGVDFASKVDVFVESTIPGVEEYEVDVETQVDATSSWHILETINLNAGDPKAVKSYQNFGRLMRIVVRPATTETEFVGRIHIVPVRS